MAKNSSTGKRLFAVVHGKGSNPLSTKTNVSRSDFDGGAATAKKAARINTGKNSANASNSRGAKKGLSISSKDGARSGGNPAKSTKVRGPSGIRSKKGKLK